MRRATIITLAALALAGCGGSDGSGHNDQVIAQAQSNEASAASIRAKLQSSLGLHYSTDYDVDDIYTTYDGDCGIRWIGPSDETAGDQVITSPNGKMAVNVETWFDANSNHTPLSACLEAARQALGW
jgi:hypothetical protein